MLWVVLEVVMASCDRIRGLWWLGRNNGGSKLGFGFLVKYIRMWDCVFAVVRSY